MALQLAFGNTTLRRRAVNVRIGLHAGEAVKDGDDFYGKNVILASRVAGKPSVARSWCRRCCAKLFENSAGASTFSEPCEVELKGLSGTHTGYRIHGTAWTGILPHILLTLLL